MIESIGHHEWLTKSNFSFLTGASHPHELIETSCQEGYRSLCLNDFDGIYGLARLQLNFEKINRDRPSELALHFGAEIHLQQDHHLPTLLQNTLVLIAKNIRGHAQLCHILTYAHRQGKNEAYIPRDELLTFPSDHLICLIPMRGPIRHYENNRESLMKLSQFYGPLAERFKNFFYLCLSRHLHVAEDCWITQVLNLQKRLDVPTLLTQDAFFHRPSEKTTSDLLHAIRCNRPLNQAQEFMFPNAQRSLHSLRYLKKLWSPLPRYRPSLLSSQQLSESIDFSLRELSYQYPREMIPDGHTSQSFLEELTWQGAKKRFGHPLDEKIVFTLKRELDLIKDLSFADYFLTVWDIVLFARGQNILCQGRGSAANSAVCYCLEITSVNPQIFDLLFERFISKERGDPPDIDVDFEHERREEVIQYIYRRYGRDRAAMVANVITYRRRGAMRAVGKALGASEEMLTTLSQTLSSKHFRQSDTQSVFSSIIEESSQQNDLTFFPWKLWAELSERIKGFPRHLGIHSGGLVIAHNPLHQIVPITPARMEGRSVIQWAKDDIEGLGLFKIDILSLGMLTALRKCFHLVNKNFGVDLGLYSIPHDDPATYSMIQKADTVGVFQIESRAQMSMLPRLRPVCFYDLVIAVAIIRPGPIQGKIIHPYLERRDGIRPVSYPDERLRPILARTLGVAIFQEQVMRIAIAIGEFSAGQADELRKNIGAWSMADFERDLNPLIEKLKIGMRKNGISEDFIGQIIGQMEGFSHYGFPESHAVSFALLAYASSYLKCHYPSAFFTSVLNSLPMGFYSPHALLQAAQRSGVHLLPPCINHSCWDHCLEKMTSPPDRPTLFAIRLGLRLINGLAKKSALSIEHKRKEHGPWKNFEQFLQSLNLPRDDMNALAQANVFDKLSVTRSEALWQSEALPRMPLIDTAEYPVNFQDNDLFAEIEKDFKGLGTSLRGHPVQAIKENHWHYHIPLEKIILAKDLIHAKKNALITVFGMTLIKQAPPSARGMVFLTLEDESGPINVAIRPSQYASFHEIIESEVFLCITGQLQKAKEHYSLMAYNFLLPQKNEAQIHFLFDDGPNNKEILPPVMPGHEGHEKKSGPNLLKPRSYL